MKSASLLVLALLWAGAHSDLAAGLMPVGGGTYFGSEHDFNFDLSATPLSGFQIDSIQVTGLFGWTLFPSTAPVLLSLHAYGAGGVGSADILTSSSPGNPFAVCNAGEDCNILDLLVMDSPVPFDTTINSLAFSAASVHWLQIRAECPAHMCAGNIAIENLMIDIIENPTLLPEPSDIWLFGTGLGLIGLALSRRARSRQAGNS